ncbi:MAG: GNAT family N-acetyltransferase [Halothiobacillaceae bacterium]
MSGETTDYWARLVVPLRLEALPLLQQTARMLAGDPAGLDEAQAYSVELAMEEAFVTIRRFAVDESVAESRELTVDFVVDPSQYRIRLHSRGLPFDFSLVPDFDPAQVEEGGEDREELATFLLKRIVDHYDLHSMGPSGWELTLVWRRPQRHIADYETQASEEVVAGSPERVVDDPVVAVEPLDESRAIELARLVYRSYGYSYVYEDIYYPERIRSNHRAGTLASWVARAQSGALVGHVALMKDSPESRAVEWGVAVVDPRWRGQGVMKRLLGAVMTAGAEGDAPVFFAHAVTTHPYTQKTCLDYGFQPVALLLGYAPATLRFRGIAESLAQRESTFISVRLQAPLPRADLYLPPAHAPLLRSLFDSLGLGEDVPEGEPSRPAEEVPPTTEFVTHLSAGLNVARIELTRIGADHACMIAHELRRLCLERIDVILLNVDLADPKAPEAVTVAEQNGFVLAGLTPMQPRPYTLTLQYLNNTTVDFSGICAEGAQATRLLQAIRCQMSGSIDS